MHEVGGKALCGCDNEREKKKNNNKDILTSPIHIYEMRCGYVDLHLLWSC